PGDAGRCAPRHRDVPGRTPAGRQEDRVRGRVRRGRPPRHTSEPRAEPQGRPAGLAAQPDRHRGAGGDLVSPTARTLTVLRRFPRHLGVDDPGKLFGSVADGLGHELDVKSVQLGRVRRSHALGDADEERDVLKLAGLHDLQAEDFEITRLRLDAAGAAAKTLSDESSTDDERTAVEAGLPDLLGLPKDSFASWPAEAD